VETDGTRLSIKAEGFVKEPKWVIFPQLSYKNHLKIENRLPIIGDEFSSYRFNSVSGSGKVGIAAGGISWAYACEALEQLNCGCKRFKVGTPHPFPKNWH
jgi:indolepyruvate ferredoxin oxidoreductase alpha subunit